MTRWIEDFLHRPLPEQAVVVVLLLLASYGAGTLCGEVRRWLRYQRVRHVMREAVRERLDAVTRSGQSDVERWRR